MKNQWLIHTPGELQAVAKEIVQSHTDKGDAPLLICLQGDLGAGKTAFTQELGKLLGVTEHIVSPTFVVMKQYAIEHTQFDQLVHIDAYRIEDIAEAGPLRLAELFQTPRTLVCLEWPEKISAILPEDKVEVLIEIGEGEGRKVTLR